MLAGKAAAAEEVKGLVPVVKGCGLRELRKREVRLWEGKAGRERRWEQSYWHWSEAEARWSAVGRSPNSTEESAAAEAVEREGQVVSTGVLVGGG
ncbi:hypothetical protein GUJ93_ZPchr0004g38591 [Zizania palustris]|uniref:Uncharacterized protein n=1 Tax=Zizania palustris TaxID=103762 RepID=A0A8J5VYJ9_ZIZPA|nr:hypothetical protein GUJ93_ZPchr0004g38591 [Zizania palustris]